MKIEWEESDVICGRIVCKPYAKKHKNDTFTADGNAAKWTMKIGYVNGSSNKKDKDDNAGVVLIALTDGMVGKARTKKEMAEYLNIQGLVPMPHNQFIKTMEYLRDVYER